VGDFIDSQMLEKTSTFKGWVKAETKAFKDTFSFIKNKIGIDAFRRYSRKKYIGSFLISGFEVIGIGIGHHISSITSSSVHANLDYKKISQEIWDDEEFQSCTGMGVSASARIPKTLAIGRRIFSPR
jgi:hypothetical protein